MCITYSNEKFSKTSKGHFSANNNEIDMNRVVTLILGGGQGKRLFPLTESRCKPAITFGGRYRLIDIPMSNAINSGCQKIFIVTQFLSTSLHQHIFRTYSLGSCSSGFIEILAAEQKPSKEAWFQGTADAVRQNVEYFTNIPADYFLILSGDQLYQLDFQKMVAFAKSTKADLVIAALPINEEDAKRMGVMHIDEDHFITKFMEKPQDAQALKSMEVSKDLFENNEFASASHKKHLGSMGIYLFKREALINLLKEDPRADFGQHLIPTIIPRDKTAAYLHHGHWEDIGTIESFYKANMDLATAQPTFNLYDEHNPIYSCHYHLPPPKIVNSHIKNSIFCQGSIIEGAEISGSILGPRTMIKKGTHIHNSYIMGNDALINASRDSFNPSIGENCLIEKAIIDKEAHIGRGVQLINKKKLQYYNGDGFYIREGIIVVARGAHIPDGFIL